MRTALSIAAAALALAACAPQTIIANRQQAVIESHSATAAVELARQECGKMGRWPLLQRENNSTYWFACNAPEPSTAEHPITERKTALPRPIEIKKAEVTPPVMPPPALETSMTAAAPKPDPAPAAPPPATKKPRAAAKGSWVQLGAFKDKAVAEQYVADIRKAHAAAMKGHNVTLTAASLGSRGRYLMARLGPYRRAADAEKACGSLKARGAPCFVTAAR